MRSEIIQEILQTIETEVQLRPTPVEFEMAYQARVAMDRIRFVIKHVEQFGPRFPPGSDRFNHPNARKRCRSVAKALGTRLFRVPNDLFEQLEQAPFA